MRGIPSSDGWYKSKQPRGLEKSVDPTQGVQFLLPEAKLTFFIVHQASPAKHGTFSTTLSHLQLSYPLIVLHDGSGLGHNS